MNADELLGQNVVEARWTDLSHVPPQVIPADEDDDETYVSLPGAGLSAVADGASVITTIQLHNEGHEGFTRYQGELPRRLDFSMGRAAVRALLGPPTRSGEQKVIHPFGLTHAWDRWDDTVTLHCLYSEDESSIDMVSLMTDPP